VVKITDFGIAKVLPEFTNQTSDTVTGVLVGTIRYMSPEQLRGKSISPRWDIWALTVIVYESLCGTAPFAGTDYTTLQSSIMGINFPEVTTLVPEAPAKWQEFFASSFSHIEENRPATVESFWTELKQSLE